MQVLAVIPSTASSARTLRPAVVITAGIGLEQPSGASATWVGPHYALGRQLYALRRCRRANPIVLYGLSRNRLRGAFTAFLGVFTELRAQERVSSQRSNSLEGGREKPVGTDLTRKCGSIDVRTRVVESREAPTLSISQERP